MSDNQNPTKKKRGILNGITTVLVILVVILAIALAGVRLVGISPYVVSAE